MEKIFYNDAIEKHIFPTQNTVPGLATERKTKCLLTINNTMEFCILLSSRDAHQPMLSVSRKLFILWTL